VYILGRSFSFVSTNFIALTFFDVLIPPLFVKGDSNLADDLVNLTTLDGIGISTCPQGK
jgi:hypothetical protein